MRSIYKIFHPEVFQGSLKQKKYFEGWYFKHNSASGDNAFAVIPGISLSEDSHSFIQFIDGTDGKTIYFRYPLEAFSFSSQHLEIQIGESVFSSEGINLKLLNEEFRISGNMRYGKLTKIPKSILMPGIMGWYSYVPWMECNHEVISALHKADGSVNINGGIRNFSGGTGYIEKDWGISFPESWIWMQCNTFNDDPVSVMISIAKIPWMRSYFMGFISFISIGGEIKILATYNGARIKTLRRIDNLTEIKIVKGNIELSALITGKGTGFLKAPLNGLMKNSIKESIDSEVYIELKKENKLLYSGNGIRAGFEETDKIFSYF